MHQQCQEEFMSCLFFFSSFFPDFLIIFASITILGNAHRPCKQYTNIVNNNLCHVTPFTSPLNLWREDSFISLDLNEIFSILTQNFAFLPRKLMVSHSQGFRVSSLPSTFLCLTLQGFADRVNYLVMAQILAWENY